MQYFAFSFEDFWRNTSTVLFWFLSFFLGSFLKRTLLYFLFKKENMKFVSRVNFLHHFTEKSREKKCEISKSARPLLIWRHVFHVTLVTALIKNTALFVTLKVWVTNFCGWVKLRILAFSKVNWFSFVLIEIMYKNNRKNNKWFPKIQGRQCSQPLTCLLKLINVDKQRYSFTLDLMWYNINFPK